MERQRVAIIDYGMGNIHSVKRRLDRIGAAAYVASTPKDLAAADKLVLPGVGHFQKAMEKLQEQNLVGALNQAVHERHIPILGICLGMQLFANHSEEGNAAGLGWINANVVRFKVVDPLRFKIPHMGWNGITASKQSRLLEGVMELDPEFYFVHSYHFVCHDVSDALCVTDYGYPFSSAVEKANIFGVQFHPEKSHSVGELMLKNFVAL